VLPGWGLRERVETTQGQVAVDVLAHFVTEDGPDAHHHRRPNALNRTLTDIRPGS
jgi:hypothetical protein